MRSLLVITIALIWTATGMAADPVARRVVPKKTECGKGYQQLAPGDEREQQLVSRYEVTRLRRELPYGLEDLGPVPADGKETIESRSPLFDVITHALKDFKGQASTLGRPYTLEEKLELLALQKIFVDRGGRIVIDRDQNGSHSIWAGESVVVLSDREDFFNGTYLHELRHARDAYSLLHRTRPEPIYPNSRPDFIDSADFNYYLRHLNAWLERKTAWFEWEHDFREKNPLDIYRSEPVHDANFTFWTESNAIRGQEQHVNYPYTEALRRLTEHPDFFPALEAIMTGKRQESAEIPAVQRQVESHVKTIFENLIVATYQPIVPLLARREYVELYKRNAFAVKRNFVELFQSSHWKKTARSEHAAKLLQQFDRSRVLVEWLQAKIRSTYLKDFQRRSSLGDNAWKELLLFSDNGLEAEHLKRPVVLKKILLQIPKSRYTEFEKILTNSSRLPFAEYRNELQRAVFRLTGMKSKDYREDLELALLTLGYTACPDAGDLDKNPLVLNVLETAVEEIHAIPNGRISQADVDRFLRPSIRLLKKSKNQWAKSDKFRDLMIDLTIDPDYEMTLHWFISHGVKLRPGFWQRFRWKQQNIRLFLAIAKRGDPQRWIKKMKPALMSFLERPHLISDRLALKQALKNAPTSPERSELLKFMRDNFAE